MSSDAARAATVERSSTIGLGDWQTVPLCDVADISRGTSWANENERREPVDGALPVLGIKNVQARLETGDLLWLHGLKPSAIASSTVQTGDILMVGSNGNPARIGNAVQIDEPGSYLFASLLFGLRPRRKSVDPDFLYQAIIAPGVQTAISDAVQGTTGLSNLKITTLRDLPVDLPPLDEQRRIADVLRSLDEAIAANLSALKQARLLQSCIAEDFLAKHSHDAEIKLRGVVVETGSGWSPSCDPEVARPDEWGILKTSAITWDGYDDGECKKLPNNLEPKPDLAVRPQDILITRAGQAYRTGVVSFVYATSGTRMISDKIIRIRADEAKILPVVLCQILKGSSVQRQLNPLKSGLTTLTNITQKMIGDVTFPLPPMSDQRLFMEAVKSVDGQIGHLVREAGSLGDLKSTLSADLLSGHVRVPA